MASEINNYQCKACDGPLHYDGTIGMLKCDYCDSTFTTEEMEAHVAEEERKATEAFAEVKQDELWGEGMKGYSCPSCGAEVMCDETTAATSCPYCGNPAVIPGQFAGMQKPDYIIPFKLDKKAAVEALKSHYKGKKFLPKEFTSGNHIEEIQGVYVPFWMFDGTASGYATYDAEKHKKQRKGDYEIIDIDHFKVQRAGHAAFEKIPADASSKMPDDYMDSIEPFDYKDLKEFSNAYMPGFLADKYDVSKEECGQRIIPRIENSMSDLFRSTVVNYDSVNTVDENIKVKTGNVSYAMMPVWLLNTKWNGQDYLFAANGQTGKMVGNLPIDKKKAVLTFLGIFAVIFALGFFLLFQDSFLTALIIALVVAGITCGVFAGQMKSVAIAKRASAYLTEKGLTLTQKKDHFTHKTQEKRKIENK